MDQKVHADIQTKPFACFMGKWQGSSKTFDVSGELLAETPVTMEIAWKDGDTFTQIENIKNLYQVGEVSLKSEITVAGKTASAKTDHLDLKATELAPLTYLFRVESGVSHTTLHNTHFFLDEDTRCVVTHKMKNEKTFVFQFQKFHRIL